MYCNMIGATFDKQQPSSRAPIQSNLTRAQSGANSTPPQGKRPCRTSLDATKGSPLPQYGLAEQPACTVNGPVVTVSCGMHDTYAFDFLPA